jgi:hypothetical protein
MQAADGNHNDLLLFYCHRILLGYFFLDLPTDEHRAALMSVLRDSGS